MRSTINKPTASSARKTMMPSDTAKKFIVEKKTITKTINPKKVVKFVEEKKEVSAPPAVPKTSKHASSKFAFELISDDMGSDLLDARKTLHRSSVRTRASTVLNFGASQPEHISEEQQKYIDQLKMAKKELIEGGEDTVEIGLVLDVTASMSNWIERAKETITEIIDQVVKENEAEGKIVPKITFVGYRDHSDGERFLVKPFTSNVADIKEFINEVPASGGGDTPEDVVGGLKMCLMQDWSALAGKKVFFIADAPCHGKEYHDECDYYPEGSPDGLKLEDLMREFAEKDIDFNIVKLDNNMNKMIMVMRAYHDDVEVQDFSVQMKQLRVTRDVTERTAICARMSSTYVENCNHSLRKTAFKSRSNKC